MQNIPSQAWKAEPAERFGLRCFSAIQAAFRHSTAKLTSNSSSQVVLLNFIVVSCKEPKVWTNIKWFIFSTLGLIWIAGVAPRAEASITVLLEEPYSYDGGLAGTGHTAIYLSRICAATPVNCDGANRESPV